MYDINNKEFKSFYMNRISKYVNRNGIKAIRFNKKSISVTIDKEIGNFFFSNLFSEKSLFNEIITYLSLYIKENDLICFNTYGVAYDIDFLKHIFCNGIKINYR